jgi:Uma2 family endonuclease
MNAVIDLNRKYSAVDYLSWNDNIRRELIEGAVKLMSGINRWHNDVTVGISEFFARNFDRHKHNCYLFYAPFDVFLSDDTVVQPDFGIVCDLSKVTDSGIHGAPDFIVEILSPSSLKHDAHEKFSLYEKFGVKEYWIISPREKCINVFILQTDGRYDNGTTYDINQNADIPISIIEGLKIKVSDIFK